ncbi:hypothetical protein B7463_g8446, partial [Scytalidium lignicola]
MVGVPRSTGCLTCIRRRVKVGIIPGPHYRCLWAQVVANSAMRSAQLAPSADAKGDAAKAMNVVSNSPLPEKRLQSVNSSTRESAAGYSIASEFNVDTPWTLTNHICSSSLAHVVPFYSPIAYQSQLLSIFIIEMSRQRAMPRDIRLFTNWLSQVPEHLGHNSALDSAVSCLGLHISGLTSGSKDLVGESRRLYGRALSNLQRSISSRDAGLSSETLCATMMLSLYELFACTEDSSWVKHSGGAGQLIKLRGPKRHKSGFDRDMFNAFKGVIVLKSIATETSCFLDNPKWESISIGDARNPEDTGFVALCDELTALMVRCPALLQQKNTCAHSENRRLIQEPIKSLSNLQDSFLLWNQKLIASGASPTLVLSKPTDSLFPFVHNYECSSIASLWCHYYAVMIIINKAIEELELSFKSQAKVPHTLVLVEEICKSVSYASNSGLFGLFYITFCLKVAIKTVDGPVKLWIYNQLNAIAKIIPVAHPESL